MLDQLTVCAIATSPGMGAIATIRLSGEKAIEIADSVFQSPKSGKKLADQQPNTLHFGSIADGNELIDEVVVSVFRSPHSFTGEDVVEITCHGSVYILLRYKSLFFNPNNILNIHKSIGKTFNPFIHLGSKNHALSSCFCT